MNNERMKETNRLVFIASNREKIAITKKEIFDDDTPYYFVSFTDGIEVKIVDKNTNTVSTKKNTIFCLSEVFIEDGSAVFRISAITNSVLRSIWALDGYNDLHEIFMFNSPCPEDEIHSMELLIPLENLSRIATDIDMFREMFDCEMVVAEEETLKKYGINIVCLRVVEGENKRKVKNHSIKPKLSIVKKEES